MPKRFLLLLFFITPTYLVYGQNPKFYANIDARQILPGNYFEVQFTIENAQGQSFRPPSFREFELVSGPNQSSQMSIINGRTSQSMSYSYVLTSRKPGRYRIGSATVLIGGKEFKTEELQIEVLKADPNQSNPAISSEAATMVLTELDYDRAYVGQQLSLKYVLLTSEDVRSYNFGTIPEFDGFFAQEIQNYNENPERVIYNGKQYVRRVIKLVTLFPQQKGEFEIPSIPMEVGIANPNERTGFFLNIRLRPLRLSTEPKKVQILNLPDHAPKNFSGAVGKFEMTAFLDKKTITQDQGLSLTMQIRGIGDPRFLLAPSQDFGEDFDTYDPNLLSENTDVRGDKLEANKSFEYLLVPRKTGKILILPSFSYFDPEIGEYVSVTAENMEVNVVPGSAEKRDNSVEHEIKLPRVYSKYDSKSGSESFASSGFYLGLNLFMFMSLLGLIGIKRVQRKRAGIDPKIQRYSSAKKIVRKHLYQAESSLKEGNTKQFYIDVRKALIDYLSSKTKQETNQLSKEDISALLRDNQMDEFQGEIMDLLQKGEQAVYAQLRPDDENTVFEQLVRLIEQMEKQFQSNQR